MKWAMKFNATKKYYKNHFTKCDIMPWKRSKYLKN